MELPMKKIRRKTDKKNKMLEILENIEKSPKIMAFALKGC